MIDDIRRVILDRIQAVIECNSTSTDKVHIKQHIIAEQVRLPQDWKEEFNLHRGQAFGISHKLNQLWYFRPQIKHPYIKNLYRVGASTRPGNGVPLVMIGLLSVFPLYFYKFIRFFYVLGARLTAALILKDSI